MGLAWSFLNQSYPPRSLWGVEDIPDLSGKVVIVTGGNSGIGYETCKALLQKNAKVYMAARSKAKAEDAINELKQATGKEAIFLALDLASLKSIKASVEEFKSREEVLHILFNNGGVMAPPMDQLTAEGYDLQFGTNVLGHFYLTRLLLPLLMSTAKASADRKVRVVTVSSFGAEMHKYIDWDSLRDGSARRKKNTQTLYNHSKFGNDVFAQELARKYGKEGIVSTSVHPGNISTDVTRNYSSINQSIFGALTQLWAGTSPEGADFNGKYLIPWARIGTIPRGADDPALGEKLWDWMEEQVKLV
ncbi:hypothetical protein BOTBODRAFT_56500 [Botryobasidium botryosum FD-172 SS1]|uniref:NAD(P)-binding protein n=1 Tax=Botryobasidium botryosum (strain FD-172 SS1) TaxID=930990 RepID=A0A067MD92_BOTB1|nr:hypothetical protein BOTBODRAFT_56500 [Botryobasidium botryosum FD-172 SS1]